MEKKKKYDNVVMKAIVIKIVWGNTTMKAIIIGNIYEIQL